MDQLIEIRQAVAKLKRAFQPDVIHMNCFGPSCLLHHDTVNAHAAPLLVTVHTMPQSMMSERSLSHDGLFKRTLRAASWVTGVSAAVLGQARQLVPEITPRSFVLYNGVECPTTPLKPLNFDTPRILCLGRLAPEKGFDLALKAFASIVNCFPRVRLIIAGEGPSRTSLENQVTDLGLAHSVEFIGWVPPDGIPALLNGATMVVMPSHREGLPSVALEAALMARPVVATRVGGLPEIVLDQKTGLLVAQDDHEALAQAIMFLLNHPGTAVAFGEAARQWVQETFAFERYVNGYDDLYQKIAGQVPCVGSA